MLKNYLKIAFRNLVKQKGYTFINTIGLAIGMGVCLFLVLLTQYAFTFDQYHENSEQIYRLADKIIQNNGDILDVAISPSPWGQALVGDYPEIKESVRFMGRGAAIQYEDKILRQGVTYVDESIFRVFTYPFKYGNPEGALARPNSIVLSEEMSIRYFADENPVGKILLLDKVPFEITGVLQKLNPQSTFFFNSLASFSTLNQESYSSINNWRSHNLYTYLLLEEGTNIAQLESKFPEFIEKNVGEEYVGRYTPHLQNISELLLYSNLFAEHGETLDVSYIYIFSAIGLLILIIACINFVNLATAQGLKRAKEVGVRKVMGAYKRQLIFQFLAEAFLIAFLAVLIGLVFVEFALPWFNNLAEWSVTADYSSNPTYIISIIGFVILVGLFAGGYPAFILSSFKPVKVLKGENTGLKGKSFLKTGLVITQFTVAIFMIISTGAVDRQLDYLKNKDLGFNKNDVLITGIPSGVSKANLDLVKDELFRIPGVSEVSFSSNIPGNQSGSRSQFYPEGELAENGILANYYSIDDSFITQFGLTLLEGRDFSSELSSDSSSSLIINEAAVQKFGWENPIGKTISVKSQETETQLLTVVGVVKDFHFETLQSSIKPLVILNDYDELGQTSIRISSENTSAVVEQITETLKSLNGGIPLGSYYLEEDIATDYITEEVIGEMLKYFTYLTIFIACLGLLGLVSFTVINRRKEIGIRKVLGASVFSIVQSISFQFLKLVLIGFIVGAPLAYFLVTQWLNSFAYSTPPSAMVFIGSGIVTILIALLTIGYQAVKAALANPVDSLKNE
ncbi:MAG: ABC transporter permease [Balneolaceae bacterium]